MSIEENRAFLKTWSSFAFFCFFNVLFIFFCTVLYTGLWFFRIVPPPPLVGDEFTLLFIAVPELLLAAAWAKRHFPESIGTTRRPFLTALVLLALLPAVIGIAWGFKNYLHAVELERFGYGAVTKDFDLR